MRLSETHILDAGARLQKVESLLDQALADLVGDQSSAPASHCAAILTTASDELRAFAHAVTLCAPDKDYPLLRPRVQGLLLRLKSVERLLSSAAEFYRGWCAAVPPSHSYSLPAGYGPDHSSFGPALLALEG